MNRKLYTNEALGIACFVEQEIVENKVNVYGLTSRDSKTYVFKTVIVGRKYKTVSGDELHPMTEERPWPKYLLAHKADAPGSFTALCCVDFDN